MFAFSDFLLIVKLHRDEFFAWARDKGPRFHLALRKELQRHMAIYSRNNKSDHQFAECRKWRKDGGMCAHCVVINKVLAMTGKLEKWARLEWVKDEMARRATSNNSHDIKALERTVKRDFEKFIATQGY